MVRVRDLALELQIDSAEVLEFLNGVGVRTRGGASAVLGESTSARVRGKFRPVRRRPAVAPENGRPDIPERVPGATAVVPEQQIYRPQAPTLDSVSLLNPFGTVHATPSLPSQAAPKVPASAPKPSRLSAASARPTRTTYAEPALVAPIVDADSPEIKSLWRNREIPESEQAEWIAAGLRATDAPLADQCRTAGLTPGDLALKLSGRSALNRLRDGEAATSVWARIQDGEHHPRKPTRLSGRFHLGNPVQLTD